MNKNAVFLVRKMLLLVLIIAFSFTFSLAENTKASDEKVELTLELINEAFDAAYPNGGIKLPEEINNQTLNLENTRKYEIPIYGQPFSKGKNGKMRYIGVDYKGNPIPHPDYPPDSVSPKPLKDMNWDVGSAKKNASDKSYIDTEIIVDKFKNYGINEHFDEAVDVFANNHSKGSTGDMTAKQKENMYAATMFIYPPTAITKGIAVLYNNDDTGKHYFEVLLDKAEKAPPPPSLIIKPDPPPKLPDGKGKLLDLKASTKITKGRKLNVNDIEVTGEITLHSDEFDVSRAIPTGEHLDIKADFSHPYLFDYSMDRIDGVEPYNVVVIKPYVYEWIDNIGKKRKVEKVYKEIHQVSRRYSYYKLAQLYYYALDEIVIDNNKLSAQPPLKLTLADGALSFPSTVYTQHKKFVKMPSLNSSVDYDEGSRTFTIRLKKSTYKDLKRIKSFDFSSLAENSVPELMVRNDRVLFDGDVLSDDDWRAVSTNAPESVPSVSADKLERRNHLLSDLISNGKDDTKAEIKYSVQTLYQYSDNLLMPTIKGNPLTVHTPVVNESAFELSLAFDQRVDNSGLDALPLDKVVAIDFKTAGQHIEEKGYGNREYGKYVKRKYLRLSFPAFIGSNAGAVGAGSATYLRAGSEFDVPVGTDRLYIKAPHWLAEGSVSIDSFVIAKNAQQNSDEKRANLNLLNDIASYHKDIEITGRLFDFYIIDSPSKRWQPFFKNGAMLTAGSLNKNGEISAKTRRAGGNWQYQLPLKAGRNTIKGYENAALKLGYPIEFMLKTMGDFYRAGDGVLITAEFEHLADDGQRTAVDLYYQNDKGKYAKIGSKVDQKGITYSRADSKFSSNEMLVSTNKTLSELGLLTDAELAYQEHHLGFYDLFALTANERNLIGGDNRLPTGVNATFARAGVQLWHGKFYLPATTFAVSKGANIAEIYSRNSDLIFRSGYLVVKFRIKLYRDGNTDKARLAFITNHSNEWQVEGYDNSVDDYGTVLYYHIEQNLSDDTNEH